METLLQESISEDGRLTLEELEVPRHWANLSAIDTNAVERLSSDLAVRVGMLADTMEARRRFTAARFAILAAHVYPTRDLELMALCNDFSVYLFFLDDRVEEDERYGKSPELLRWYLESHVVAMRDGLDIHEHDPPSKLLLDLRERLLERVGTKWLGRFSRDLEDYLLRGALRGAECWTAARVPALDEYCVQRAYDSAVFCSQDLFELALGECPLELLHDAEFDRLRWLCTRVVAFANDLFSYPKEVLRQSSPNNLVEVYRRRFGWGPARAAREVVRVVNDDVATFNRIATRMCRTARPEIASFLGAYTDAQRAWMRGNVEWSVQTGRYAAPDALFEDLRRPTVAVHWIA